MANTSWNLCNFRQNVIQKLVKEDFELILLAKPDGYECFADKHQGVQFHPLKNLNRKSTSIGPNILLFFELIRQYAKYRPDLILHYTSKPNIFGGFAAAILKIPSLAVITGLGYGFIHKGWLNSILVFLYRLSLRFHKKIIFENPDDQNLFIELKIVSEQKTIHVNGSGINTSFFHPKYNVPNGKFVFAFIGRLIYDKGIREFVQAAKKITLKYSDTEVIIIGQIDKGNPAAIQEIDLVKWIEDGTIKYLGFTNDVRKFISFSSCVILPSYREGLPKTLLEGISMEKPVIATDVPGCREVVDEGENGFLIPARNAEALTFAMEKMISLSPEKRLEMGKKGRDKAVRLFDDNLIAQHYFEIISRELSKDLTQLKSTSMGPLPK